MQTLQADRRREQQLPQAQPTKFALCGCVCPRVAVCVRVSWGVATCWVMAAFSMQHLAFNWHKSSRLPSTVCQWAINQQPKRIQSLETAAESTVRVCVCARDALVSCKIVFIVAAHQVRLATCCAGLKLLCWRVARVFKRLKNVDKWNAQHVATCDSRI